MNSHQQCVWLQTKVDVVLELGETQVIVRKQDSDTDDVIAS